MDTFIYTTAGGREENQDVAVKFERGSNGIFIVADGLGGHRLGNLASEAVAQQFASAWNEDSDTFGKDGLFKRIEDAHEAVLLLQKERNCSAKSTLVVLWIVGNKALWANTGDSRLYYIRGKKLHTITEDHSVAFKKFKAGEITREQIATDEDQSSLLRALGSGRWKPEISEQVKVGRGDAFLLCSDGIWEFVTDEEILRDCLETRTAEAWAKKLLGRAETRFTPDHDNASMITVRI